MKFAVYRETETQAKFFNGAWYVVRHDMYPHTLGWAGGYANTVQGHSMLVGIRQGFTDEAGFTVRKYTLPDSMPHRGSEASHREFKDG